MSSQEYLSRAVKKIPYLKYYNVFNVFQTERLSPTFYEVPEVTPMPEFEKDDSAENLITSTGAKVIYIPGDNACYRPLSDEIQLPLRAQFTGAEGFMKWLSTNWHTGQDIQPD
jgi:antirestriction protein ArdC